MNDEKRKQTNLRAVKRYRVTQKGQVVYRRALRKYRQSNKFKIVCKRYRIVHPERYGAHMAVHYAIKVGKLAKATTLKCIYCLKQARQYHHHNGYENEHRLDVVPVCLECHKE